MLSEADLIVLGRAALAAVLGLIIGWERQATESAIRARAVGLAALTAAGVTALGHEIFATGTDRIVQGIVTGIGFLGAGVIFVKNDAVNGLTTAASVWMTAAIGMACGAGMPLLAVAGTVLHLASVTLLTMLNQRIRRSVVSEPSVEVRYRYSKAVLTAVLEVVAEYGYAVTRITRSTDSDEGMLQIRSPGSTSSSKLDQLLSSLAALRGVRSASRIDSDDDD